MSQAALLIDLVKHSLRDRGRTYADLAGGLKLSESSVKRLFSRRRLSLERLEQICAYLEIEISDLLELARSKERRIRELSEAQEQALVGDPRLLLVGLLALSYWRADEMLATYRLSESQLVAHLTRLDGLGIIDLLPGNRIKLRLARDFSWRKDGPLQRFFEASVQNEFFHSAFQGPGELRFVVHGSLSEHSNELLRKRIAKLVEEFDALADEDRRIDHRQLAGTTMIAAIRPWELGIFREFRKK